MIGGLIVVLASLASGWVAALSAFILFLGVHALESYVLTPIIQRQALDIPPATLFAFQILLGVVFGIWGLALALPLMAIAKVMIDHFKADDAPAATAAGLMASARRGQHRLGVLDFGRRGEILADQPAPGRKILRAAEIDGVVFQRLPLAPSAGSAAASRSICAVQSPCRPWRAGTAARALATAASKSFSVPGLTSICAISVIIWVTPPRQGLASSNPYASQRKRRPAAPRPSRHA